MSKRALLVSMGLCLLAVDALSAQTNNGANRSYFGKVLPEFDTEGTYWINAPKGLTLKGLRGGPTLLCYNFLG